MLFVKPPKVVSPGPVYDLRTRLGRDVRLIKPAAFVKERKFEQARFEGTADADPDAATQLVGLLSLLGRREDNVTRLRF